MLTRKQSHADHTVKNKPDHCSTCAAMQWPAGRRSGAAPQTDMHTGAGNAAVTRKIQPSSARGSSVRGKGGCRRICYGKTGGT